MIDSLIIARAVHIAATAIVAGVIFFDLVIARPVLNHRANKSVRAYFATLDRLVWAGLAVIVVSGLAWALLLAAQLREAPISEAIADGTVTTLLTETRFGQVWLGRAALVTIVAATLLTGRRFDLLRLIGAGLLLISMAWIGHAGARADAIGWLQVCADMVHLLAAGVWLGSLPALAVLLASSGRNRIAAAAIAAATRRFSIFGMSAVAALLISGIINTWLLINDVSALTETDYGRLLLLKIGLFAAMLALASINRWRWTPMMPAARAIGKVRRNSFIEAGLGLSVVAVVGILGTLPPPLHQQHVHANDAPPEAAFVHIHDVTAMADVTILPGRSGRSEVWLRLMREDFTALPAEAVTVRLTQSGQQPVIAEARSGVLGLWRAPNVVLPAAGIWSLVVEVDTGQGGPLLLDAPIVLEP